MHLLSIVLEITFIAEEPAASSTIQNGATVDVVILNTLLFLLVSREKRLSLVLFELI